MKSQIQFLEKMAPDSRSILEHYIIEKAKAVRFFSYGSNMNERKLKMDMKGKIGLVNKTTATLAGFKRTLCNDSQNHGVAFSICDSPGDRVEGICHDIPIVLLSDFLQKEGVLLKDAPSYRLIKVSILDQAEPVLTLIGLKPISLDDLNPRKLQLALDYVEKSIEGARCCDVDFSDMTQEKKRLEQRLERNPRP
jgi:hypothetical protein